MKIDRYTQGLAKAIRWPFASLLTSPAWFLVRIYLGAVWLRFGWSKVEDGWLSTNPLRPLLEAIAGGSLSPPVPLFERVAELLLALGADPILSVAIPVAELAFAAAFFAGVLLVPVAVAASLLNLNLILFGIASWSFDGRIILLQLLLLMAWRVAGELGIGDDLRRVGRSYAELFRRLRHA